MWHKHTFKQTVIFSLIFSIIFGLFAPALTELVGAIRDPGTPTSDISVNYTPTQSVLSYIYYNAMSKCINSDSLFKNQVVTKSKDHPTMTNADINSGAWFRSAPTIADGYALKGMGAGFNYVNNGAAKDQDINCMDTDWIAAAASLWGFDSIGALYCGLGLQSGSGQAGVPETCDPSSTSQTYDYVLAGPSAGMVDRTQLMKNFQAAVQYQIGGYPTFNMDAQTTMTNPMEYVLYKGAFIGGCLETTPDGVTKLKDPNDANSNRNYFPGPKDLKMVDTDGKLDEADYDNYSTGMNDRINTDTIRAYVQDQPKGSDRIMKCVDLANGMNAFAGDYKAWIVANGSDTAARDITPVPKTNNPDATTCAITGIGWIICPVVNFMATVADAAYGYLANNFLSVKVEMFDTSSSTYSAWSIMRSFANVAFVIAFLIIIFSQLTGFGIANYGIKKLLPRIIVAAILVNLSYFICQFAVDLSNILGKSMSDLFTNVAVPSGKSPGFWSTGSHSSWSTVAGGILAVAVAGAAAAWAGLSALIPILIAAVVALVMVLFILIARQAIIVLLVVIAPLAFVAYLLPNTENLFHKWRKLLTSMLLLYPIVALIYGVSTFASKILNGAMSGSGWIGEIAAASVVVLPLFLIPSLLKKSMDGIGGIGKALNNMGSRAGKGAGKKFTDSDINRHMVARKADRTARMKTGKYVGRGGRWNPGNLRSGLNRRLNSNRRFNALTGGFGASRALAGQSQDRKEIEEAMAMFGGDDDLAVAWAQSGGDNTHAAYTGLKAAQQQQFDKMREAKMHEKATSHLAAARYISENGKGSGADAHTALDRARSAGASETDVAGATSQAIAAYRKSGRGDALAELSTLSGTAPLTATQGWDQVSASSVSRKGIDTPAGLANFSTHLTTGASAESKTTQALDGFSSMETRAQNIAEPVILAAASTHAAAKYARDMTQYGVDYAAATAAGQPPPPRPTSPPAAFGSIREAQNYFGIK